MPSQSLNSVVSSPARAFPLFATMTVRCQQHHKEGSRQSKSKAVTRRVDVENALCFTFLVICQNQIVGPRTRVDKERKTVRAALWSRLAFRLDAERRRVRLLESSIPIWERNQKKSSPNPVTCQTAPYQLLSTRCSDLSRSQRASRIPTLLEKLKNSARLRYRCF